MSQRPARQCVGRVEDLVEEWSSVGVGRDCRCYHYWRRYAVDFDCDDDVAGDAEADLTAKQKVRYYYQVELSPSSCTT